MLATRMQAVAVIGGQFVATALGLIAIMILARRVETAELGQYLYLVAVAAALEGLSDSGLRFRGVALLAQRHNPLSDLVMMHLLWKLKIILSVGTVSIIVLAALLGWIPNTDPWLALLVGLVCVTLPSSSPVVWQARAAGWQLLEAISLVLYRMLLIGVALVPEARAIDASFLLVGLLLCNAAFLFLMLALRSFVPGSLDDMPESATLKARLMLAESWPLGMSLLISQFAPRMFVIWSAFVAVPAIVAELSIGMAVVQTVLVIGAIMSALYLPVLGRLHGASEPAARDLTAATLQAAIILGCGFGIFIALAPISVASVLFGADLADTGTFLRILIAVSPFLLVSFVARLVLTAGALGRVDIRANMIGLGVSIIGGALMLPMFGVRGLMVAYVCGEVTGASFKVRAIARLHGLQWSELSPVTRVAPILLGAAIWTGAMIESGAGAGARWLVVAMSMTLVLLAAMAFGPWGGREIVAPLRNS